MGGVEKPPPPSGFARAYYTPSNPASYGGVKALARAVNGATEDQALAWLQTQDTYTLHRPARKTLRRDPIVVSGLDDQWEADLVDVQPQASLNKGYRFLLTVIDTLSKYAWVVPLKDKTGESTAKAFIALFERSKRIPRKLRTDSGKEFENATLKNFLKKRQVHHFTAKNRTKAAVVERFNRTLRSKIWKYFHATGKQRYVDVLPQLVASYNATVHSTTRTSPASVTPYNAESVWRKVYGHLLKGAKKKRGKKRPSPRYAVGDVVRISRDKGTFEKGYKTGWIEELFTVQRVIPASHYGRHRYELVDAEGEPIYGRFKEEELQRIRPSKPREIKKTVARTAQQKAVRWRGYPDELVTWINR